MPSKLHIMVGDEAFEGDDPTTPLIENVLYKDDIVLLFGSEKAGKSILAQQIAFSLTSGEPFLGKFKVVQPCNVLYIQTEGKKNEGMDRRLRMEKAIRVNRKKYAHFYKKFLPIDLDPFRNILIQAIKSLPWKPDVIFLDALYMGMQGDLIDNKEVRKFEENFGQIIEEFAMTGILVHHESKEPTDKEGDPIERGDKGTYGSVFIRSWVDHIFYLRKRGGRTRTLICDTQRSGKVFNNVELVLIGDSERRDDPLYFEINDMNDAAGQEVLAAIRFKKRVTIAELVEAMGKAESTILKSVRHLITDKKIKEVEKGVYIPC